MCLFKLNQHCHLLVCAIRYSVWILVHIFSLPSYTVGVELVQQNMKAVQCGLSGLCAPYKEPTLFYPQPCPSVLALTLHRMIFISLLVGLINEECWLIKGRCALLL